MSDYRPANVDSFHGHADVAVDAGLRSYMLAVYNCMGVGVALTGLAAYFVFWLSVTSVGAPDAVAFYGDLALTSFGRAIFSSPLTFVIIFVPFVPLLFLNFRINTMEVFTAQLLFGLYSVLLGVSFSVFLLVYTGQSIASVFFISSSAFFLLSLHGYTTSKSLTGVGSFVTMGLFGLVIAMVVNLFLRSSALDFALSVIGVLVFAGLTAYDTQKLKNGYLQNLRSAGEAVVGRSAVMGALTLYLDFVNLFVFLLHLFGNRR